MTVIVTKMPGGVVQLFNPDTGKVTYNAKADTAYLYLEAFDGIVKFSQKGSKVAITGTSTTIDDCEIIKQDSSKYNEVLIECLKAEETFLENKKGKIDSDILNINEKIKRLQGKSS